MKRYSRLNIFRLPLVVFLLMAGYGSANSDHPEDVSQPHTFAIQGEGIEMYAYLYFPPGKGPFSVIVSLPGGRARSIGRVHPFSKNFGAQMAKRGIAVLVLDYSSFNRAVLDPRQIQDIGAAVDFLKKHDAIQKQNIFLVGFSMGGANALRVAGTRDDIAGLVCYFTPNDWRLRGSRFPPRIDKQPVDYCADIACPVLILHGEKDTITEVQQSQHLYVTLKSLNKDARLVIYEGAGHGFTYQGIQSKGIAYDAGIAAKSFDEVEQFVKAHTK